MTLYSAAVEAKYTYVHKLTYTSVSIISFFFTFAVTLKYYTLGHTELLLAENRNQLASSR